MKSKRLKAIFFVVGLLLFGYLVYCLGWDNLLNSFQQIGWSFLIIIGLAISWQGLHTLAWAQILRTLGHKIHFGQLFALKLIAEAINTVAPTANIGGDTFRAYLANNTIPPTISISSVMIDKTLDYITKLLFNIAGVLLSIFLLDIPRAWLVGFAIALTIIFILNALLVYWQIKGVAGSVQKLGRFIPPLKRLLEKKQQELQSIDGTLRRSYTQNPGGLLLAGLWHTLGRVLGVVEIWLILGMLQIPITFTESFFIASVVNIVMSAFFLIPGQWGVSEIAQKELAEMLGFTTVIGLTLGIVRRARRLVMTIIGLICFLFYKKEKKAAVITHVKASLTEN